jgi:integrase
MPAAADQAAARVPRGVRGRSCRSAVPRRTGRSLPSVTYRRAWDRARKAALPAEAYRSPLARRPYDLRHACLSTWLNGGVPATQVAGWAGHSVQVLLRVYAKCLDGRHTIAKRRITDALDDE